MASARPYYRLTWATNAPSRTLPAGGTVYSGYGPNAIPTHGEWNWEIGTAGDLTSYLDDTTLRSADAVSANVVQRVSTSTLGFSIGGPLAQYPTTGGVYIIGGLRVDLSAVGALAVIYNFVLNTTNYIWARAPLSTSRLAYGDVTVTQVLASPGTGYENILNVTTGPLTVTAVTAPATVKAGLYWSESLPQYHRTTLHAEPSTAVRALSVLALNGAAEAAAIGPGDASMVTPMLRILTNTNGIGMEGITIGSGTTLAPLVRGKLDTNGAAVWATANNFGASGGATIVSDLSGTGFDVAMKPGGSPSLGTALSGFLRMYSEASTVGGGLRWREPVADKLRIPHCGEDGFITVSTIAANTAALTNAAGTFTLVTSPSYVFRQNHTYIISYGAETLVTGPPTYTVTVVLEVNATGVGFGGVGGRFVQPDPQLVYENPWLNDVFVYTHTAADVSATARVRITHQAVGAGTISYRTPRISVFGGWR